MNIIFMNSKNGKTTDPDWLLLNLIDKINLKRSDKSLMDYICIRYSRWFSLYLEKNETVTNNPSIRMYVKK